MMTDASDIAPCTCESCGADFALGVFNRCESCGGFFCRDCLKIAYDITASGDPVIKRILCYFCHHHENTGNSIDM